MLIQVKGRPGQSPAPASEENRKDDEILTPTPITEETSSDKENKSEAKPEETKVEKRDMEPQGLVTLVKVEATAQEDDSSDEGWQEAVPKNRYPSGRRIRPSLAKLNTNFTNVNQQTSSKGRGKHTNFAPQRTSPNEVSISAAGSTSQHAKKALKSPSLIKKQNSPSTVGEKPVSYKPAIEQINKPTPVTVQAGKLFSYKEVALAPPGTIVKLVAEQLTEETAVPETLDAEKVAVNGPEEAKAEEVESEDKHVDTGKEAKNADSDEQGVVAAGGSKLMSSPEDAKAEKSAEKGSPTATATSDASQGISESVQTAKDSNGSGPVTGVKQQKDVEAKAVDGETEDPPNGDSSPKSSVVADEGEKQDACEAQKEMSKKLSASAPPYTPTTIPIFGSITVPGFNDHMGILPSPPNIPPMLPVNHVRRSTPHQSVTARVPYGPRLSGGGYNRSGNRVARNKPSFSTSPESNGEATQFIGPRIMNPHAAEFIPSQPWVSNGYPVSPNGYLVSPNGTEVTQNGYPPLSPVAGAAYPCNIPAQLQNGDIIPASLALEELPGTESAEEKSGGEEEKKAAEDDEVVTIQESKETPENGHSAAGEEKPTEQEISNEN